MPESCSLLAGPMQNGHSSTMAQAVLQDCNRKLVESIFTGKAGVAKDTTLGDLLI